MIMLLQHCLALLQCSEWRRCAAYGALGVQLLHGSMEEVRDAMIPCIHVIVRLPPELCGVTVRACWPSHSSQHYLAESVHCLLRSIWHLLHRQSYTRTAVKQHSTFLLLLTGTSCCFKGMPHAHHVVLTSGCLKEVAGSCRANSAPPNACSNLYCPVLRRHLRPVACCTGALNFIYLQLYAFTSPTLYLASKQAISSTYILDNGA